MIAPGKTMPLGYHAINIGTMNVAELAKPPRGTPNHGEIPRFCSSDRWLSI